MAEPLTSSDIIRERMGFGVSPLASGETRRAYAEAGLSPLGTQARQRFEEGRGISPMASAQEKEAWKMAEFMGGQREQAPISYGGIGDRPVGASRRDIRMQAEWDKRQTEQLQMQRMMQQMEDDQKRLELQSIQEERMQRAERSAIDAALAKESRELEIETQADRAMKSILGTTLPNGQRTRPINVNDDDAVERIQSVVASNPYGMESQIVKETVSMMLNDALNIRQGKIDQSKQQELAAANLSARTLKPMSEFGEYNEQGIFQPNIKGMIAGAEEVKAGEEAKAQEATIATETRRAEAAAGVAEKKTKESQQREIQRNIRKATEDLRKVNASLAGRKSLSESQRANLTAAKDALIDLQIERAALDDLAFETPESYGAALKEGRTFPSGTTIYIGRTPVKVK